MSKKHHSPGPIPPGNRPHSGPAHTQGEQKVDPAVDTSTGDAPFQEEDPKRRLGDYTGTGEHSIQQPGPRNDGDHHSK